MIVNGIVFITLVFGFYALAWAVYKSFPTKKDVKGSSSDSTQKRPEPTRLTDVDT